MTLMIQREVAERIMASPGDLSVLAISVQVYGTPEIICRVPASAFYPAPKVDSAVLRVRMHAEPRIPPEEVERFFRVVHAGFAQRRKQVHNSLTHSLHISSEGVREALAQAQVAPDRRAQTLDIAEWAAVARNLLPLR
jgi:16S rRNA (adenine1518-N6/adenine1519-N6)-dimethyltransferase